MVKSKSPRNFSKWFKWSDRNSIENSDFPGVYLLAKFKRVPKGNVNPLKKGIIYIGETCSSLKKRWRQFDRSAFKGKDGHSGGKSYRKKFKDKGSDLYVAAMPVNNSKKFAHLYIRYWERELILDFALKCGSQPPLNKK